MSSSPSTSGTNTAARLESALGYRFCDSDLLTRALTHKSHSKEHNERLEFLGDAVLGFVIAERIYNARPDAHEDTMSLLRASVVRKESLAQAAKAIGLGDHLRLGSGVKRSGGHRLDSILADALEAVIGAVHLDGGLEPARAVVLALLDERLQGLDAQSLKDAKTRLQEVLQAVGMELPEYAIESSSGTAHARTFTVSCRVDALGLSVSAPGRSRRSAEKSAAEVMLEQVAVRLEQRGLD